MKREEFLTFIEKFQTESKDFENNTLESFLEAMARYSRDIDGYYSNTGQSIDLNKVNWKVFADILQGAATYE